MSQNRSHKRNPLREATPDERALMRLLRVKSVRELNRLLAQPPSEKDKAALARSGPEDEAYALANLEAQQELRQSPSVPLRISRPPT